MSSPRAKPPESLFRSGKFVPIGEMMTKGQFGEQSDINTIVAKFISTGSMEWFNRREPRYGDFTGVQDYHSALNRVVELQQAFDQLPGKVRAAFDNDPAQLLAAVEDQAQHAQLRALGFELPEAPGGRSPEEPPSVPEGTSPPPKAASAPEAASPPAEADPHSHTT